jgi:hypothetical protein
VFFKEENRDSNSICTKELAYQFIDTPKDKVQILNQSYQVIDYSHDIK